MFKRILQVLLVGCLATATLRAANDPFVGDWKLNPSKSKLTDQMKVESLGPNKYAFDFEGNGNAETIVADGTDQPGLFGTTLSVTVEGTDALKVVRKEKGRTIIMANWRLSKDGNTLRDDFTGINPNGSTYNLNYVYKRSGAGSGFAGTWLSTSEALTSAFVLQLRSYEGDGLSIINPSSGTTTNMKFDGKDYPTLGANVPPGFTSSVHRVNEHLLETTDKFNGKIRGTQQIKLSSDLNGLTMTVQRVGRSFPNILVFERQ
ncbi:MAG: hypothetical protein ACM34G_09590 [Acidobacteriota bacterium]